MKYLVLLAVVGVVLSGVDAELDPVACYVDGVKYEPLDEIPSDDPCESCFCGQSSDGHGSVQCISIACPPLPCFNGLLRIPKEGECCYKCGCVVNGTAYHMGDHIPNEDPCKSCSCTQEGVFCTSIACAIVPCFNDDLVQITKEGECCPSCRCVVDGIAYDIGENIPNADPCQSCTCTKKGQRCKKFCDVPECGLYPAITKEGECCPVCPDCPPSCSSSYCTSNPNAVCTLRGKDYCGNRLTSCRTCYYSGTERKAPKMCRRFVKMKPTQSLAGAHSIVKRWGKCVEEAYEKESTSAGRFKCIRYPTNF